MVMDTMEEEPEEQSVAGVAGHMKVCILDVKTDQGIVGIESGPEQSQLGHLEVRWMFQVALIENGEVVNHAELV